MARRRSYGEPCDSMIDALDVDVRAGKVVRGSPDWWSRYQKARHRAGLRYSPSAQRAYYQRNREACLSRSRAWREANPERCKTLHRAHYERNREAYLERSRQQRVRLSDGYDGTPAPLEGTLLERTARAVQRRDHCTFTEAVVRALGWRDVATV